MWSCGVGTSYFAGYVILSSRKSQRFIDKYIQIQSHDEYFLLIFAISDTWNL
jgi:hypothetical protein